MALTEEQYTQIRKELDECQKPFIFFDDDQDGLCSFLLLYRYKKEGKGHIVKTTPRLDQKFALRAVEYGADKVFVLDLAVLEDDFIDAIHVPIIWVDHHGPFKKHKVKYFNPKVENVQDNFPTSYLCYRTVKQDLWLAAVGCVSDWFIPEFLKEFEGRYPGMIDKPYKEPGDILYGGTRLGLLSRIFSFNLKGQSSDVMKSVRTMIKIESPYEILDSSTPRGKFIYKRYDAINRQFEPLMKRAFKAAEETTENFILFPYEDDKTSFTSDISNELTYKYPKKVVLICREKDEEMKCSLRSGTHNLPPIVEKCLIGLHGHGGGHEHACGVNVHRHHFEEFISRLKKEI